MSAIRAIVALITRMVAIPGGDEVIMLLSVVDGGRIRHVLEQIPVHTYIYIYIHTELYVQRTDSQSKRERYREREIIIERDILTQ